MKDKKEENIMNVVSSARKLIFRPEAGAQVVDFPAGAIVNQWGCDNDTPSVVVKNGTESTPSYQGVSHEKGVVIVNEVPEHLAVAALEIFNNGGRTNAALQAALDYLVSNGCVDQYTTSLSFVETKLSPAGMMLDNYTGIVKRDDRDLTPVWHENGTYYTAPNGEARVIEPDILIRTYRNADGSEIDLSQVPEKRPEGVIA